MEELKTKLLNIKPPYLEALRSGRNITVNNTVNMTASKYDMFTDEPFYQTVENVRTEITLFNEFVIKGEFPEFDISGSVADVAQHRLNDDLNKSKDDRLELILSEIANGVSPSIDVEISKLETKEL